MTKKKDPQITWITKIFSFFPHLLIFPASLFSPHRRRRLFARRAPSHFPNPPFPHPPIPPGCWRSEPKSYPGEKSPQLENYLPDPIALDPIALYLAPSLIALFIDFFPFNSILLLLFLFFFIFIKMNQHLISEQGVPAHVFQ